MKLILFRHATRSPMSLNDASLSTVGFAQAEDLASAVLTGSPYLGDRPPKPTYIYASPKRRAQQTLKPLSEACEVALLTDERLDERGSDESVVLFEKRIGEFFSSMAQLAHAEAKRTEVCAYACSHLDWLEAALVLLPSDLSENEMSLSWSTAEYRIFRYNDGLWQTAGGGLIAPRA